jgi:MYXO-CTERM domain-containing protein
MTRHRHALAVIALLAATSFAACHQDGVRVEDDLDFELFTAELHTPYVAGAAVRIWAWHSDDDVDPSGWSGDVEDPSVLEVLSQGASQTGLSLQCHAAGPGETTLRIRDGGGSTLTRRTIEVAQPDRLELVPAGLIKIYGDDAAALALDQPVKVLVGGTATFEVRYYQGSRRLFGNGALVAEALDQTVTAGVEGTYLFENREWLRVSVDATGLAEVALTVNGADLGHLVVRGVDEEEIASVEVVAESEQGADDEALIYLLARARDVQQVDVWGVDFDWSVDGLLDPETGDLYYYYYDGDSERTVEAARAGQSDLVTVHFTDGGVTSSNHLGCATSGGSAAGLALPLLAAGLWLMIRRRRRNAA